MEIRSSSHKYYLIRRQGAVRSYYNFFMLEEVTTLLSSHVINSLTLLSFRQIHRKRWENIHSPLNFATLLLQICH